MRKNVFCLLLVGTFLATSLPLLAQESAPAFLKKNYKHKLKKGIAEKVVKEKPAFVFRPPASDKRARLVRNRKHKIQLFPKLIILDDIPDHMYPIRPRQRPVRKYLHKKRNYPHTSSIR